MNKERKEYERKYLSRYKQPKPGVKKLMEKEKLAKELDDIILNNINQKVATMHRKIHSKKSPV